MQVPILTENGLSHGRQLKGADLCLCPMRTFVDPHRGQWGLPAGQRHLQRQFFVLLGIPMLSLAVSVVYTAFFKNG